MANIYKLFKTNTAAEKNGIAVNLGKNDEGEEIVIYVARFGGSNDASIADFAARNVPYADDIANERLDENIATRLLTENTAETLITGWKNVTDEDGNELPFSKENALKLLTDLPELAKKLRQTASNISNYLAANESVIVKN